MTDLAPTTHDPRRVVLAYSGGLDTTACIPYLREVLGCTHVVAVAVDLGQGEDLEALRQKARLAGANEAVVVDGRERFVTDFALPALAANAVYSGKYPLSSALGRPVITDIVIEEARRRRCGAVAHGSTGKGNDQVRFDLGVRLAAPDLTILAPARHWTFTRAETVRYIESLGIPAHVSAERPWAIDVNLLGRNVEAGPIEDLDWVPTEEVWDLTADPDRSDLAPEQVSIGFRDGRPMEIDGRPVAPVELITELNRRAGAHGIGRIDVIEDRIMGVKSRELYEAPGVTVLLAAHRELEQISLPRDVLAFKAQVDALVAQYAYDGLWHAPLREQLSAFVAATQEGLDGTITLRLSRGRAEVLRRDVAAGLYALDLVTYGPGCRFPVGASEGWIEIQALAGEGWRRARTAAAAVRRPAVEITPDGVGLPSVAAPRETV